jgi:hypothetical protein
MKKYMIADMVKDLRSDSIKRYIKLYKISESEIREVDDRSKEYFLYGLDEVQMSDLEKPFQIIYLEKEYQINSDEAFYLTDNWDSEAEWRDVMTTAEALNAGIEDIDDDDVENYMSMGGEAKGELESSVGLIQWLYDNKLKVFIVYLLLDGNKRMLYSLNKDQMNDWKDSDSMGEYYNMYIRSNPELEQDDLNDIACGCQENLCDPEDIASFKAKYDSIS